VDLQQGVDNTVSLLYGNSMHPWLRVDFVEQLTQRANQTRRAQQALEAFERDARAATYTAFVPSAGGLCVLNNRMCAHGRGPVQAGLDLSANVVEKRWVLRMMSIVDRFAFFETADPERPYFSNEILFGKTIDR
jgi:hypothetical protein